MLRRLWQRRGVAALLLPLSWLFFSLVWLRRRCYALGVLASHRLPVPVVVIGNITVGGAGKTPLLLHLAERLGAIGYRVGIVSRGYGSGAVRPREVCADSDAEEVGDEALLLKRRSGLPVFAGHRRADVGNALLAAYPDRQIILADDGLQHYALQRDVEIVVIDRRGLMNGWLLPAGPLREPASRLGVADACVLNDATIDIGVGVPTFRMRLRGETFFLLADKQQRCEAGALRGLRLHAFAGIGEPQRFFDHLSCLGLSFEPHACADHHRYSASDFALEADAILMTEKDAVKCLGLTHIPIWVLPVDAEVEPDLAQFVLETLNGRPPT